MKLQFFLAVVFLAAVPIYSVNIPAVPESINGLLDLQTGAASGDSEDEAANMAQLNKVLSDANKGNYNREEVSTVEQFVKRLESNIEHEELKEKHAYELIETEKSVWIERHNLKIEELTKALEEEKTAYGNRENSREFLLKMIADIRKLLKALERRDADYRNRTKEAEQDKDDETDKGKKKVGDKDHPALSCFQILETGSSDKDGVYWLDTDGPHGPTPKFQAYCDMTSDDGGWTLLISLAPSGVPFAHVLASEAGATAANVWPETVEKSTSLVPAHTGMFKGSLKPFTEVREQIASGKYVAYGSNFTVAQMESIRSMYGYETKLTATPDLYARPDCRGRYVDPIGMTSMKGCAPPEDKAGSAQQTNLWVGWSVNPQGEQNCYFGAGDGAKDAKLLGSSECPKKPDGHHWAKVWFR